MSYKNQRKQRQHVKKLYSPGKLRNRHKKSLSKWEIMKHALYDPIFMDDRIK